MTTGYVCNIQRFSVHDGPGIRTTVFLKGCTLRCFWCHNPESIRPKPEVQFFPSRCIGCAACVEVCPEGAQAFDENGIRAFDREKCIACGACVDVCYAEALVLTATAMTAESVVDEILRDRAFYENSGGGVTLSGGEPALQVDFSREILERCRTAGVHTAIETAANVPWESLAALLPLTDLVMMDIKHMDSAKHHDATGAPNALLLANARRLVESDKPIIFRIPVIPTVNDTPEEVAAIAAFVRELHDLRMAQHNANCHNSPASAEPAPITLELLAFHRMAGDKYNSLGWDYRAANLNPPTKTQMAALADAASAQGVLVLGNVRGHGR
ncbi:MAG: glycyl-radical enzyme activating protein [Anaerolineae bacterium]|nr:glycyl-radical enzyme activating protein [Anaerolineae bacterium]